MSTRVNGMVRREFFMDLIKSDIGLVNIDMDILGFLISTFHLSNSKFFVRYLYSGIPLGKGINESEYFNVELCVAVESFMGRDNFVSATMDGKQIASKYGITLEHLRRVFSVKDLDLRLRVKDIEWFRELHKVHLM